MSLLLDALKKAAEKKARKSQQDNNAHSEETQVTEPVTRGAEFDSTEQTRPFEESTQTIPVPDRFADSNRLQTPGSGDATELDVTDLDHTHLDATDIDVTGIEQTHLDATELDSTELDATELDRTHLDSTQVDVTDIEATHLDATELDATELDRPHLDSTQVDVTVIEATHLDATELDATELDRPRLDSTQVDVTDIEATHLDATELDATELDRPHLDSTQVDVTDIEATHLDATELDATELDRTHTDSTRLDASEVDATHVDATMEIDPAALAETHAQSTQLDATELDATEVEKTHLDATELDSTLLERTHLDATELDATDIDALEQQLPDELTGPSIEETDLIEPLTGVAAASAKGIEDTDSIQIISPRDMDRTRTLTNPQQALDGADEQMDETDLDLFADEDTQTRPPRIPAAPAQAESGTETLEMKPVKYLHELADAEASAGLAQDDADEFDLEPLTLDDVTEFMGDGIHNDPVPVKTASAPRQPVDPDDTTITNSDSLSLTNFGYEQDDEQANDDGATSLSQTRGADTQSIPGYEDESISFAPGFADDDRSTSVRSDATGTGTVDIEKLTNDETVTLKDSTGTRTFAPDNYDRTLLKLADRDVSRIFAGMKPDKNAVMTPDYAKKVFINKSQTARRRYYRYYIGLGVIVLAVVLLWGMDQIQQESDLIDNSLVRLRHDPLPGDIKHRLPGGSNEAPVATESPIDSRAVEIIASAGDLSVLSDEADATAAAVSGEASPSVIEQAQESRAQVAESGVEPAAESSGTVDSQAGGHAGRVENQPAKPQTSGLGQAPRRDSQARAQAREATPQSSPSSRNLSITSSSGIAEEDRLLGEAYSAYESGNLARAGELYARVTALKPTNRDALLGLAAIHVRNGDIPQAIENYRKVLLGNPKDSMALASLMSVLNVDPATGETEIKKLLSEQPASPYLHFVLGNMYGSQQRWQEAQTSYFEALRFKPDDPNYAYNLAVSLEHIEKPRVAATYYQRALDNLASGTTLAVFDRELVSQRIQVLQQ